jgi:hypothetical protein
VPRETQISHSDYFLEEHQAIYVLKEVVFLMEAAN